MAEETKVKPLADNDVFNHEGTNYRDSMGFDLKHIQSKWLTVRKRLVESTEKNNISFSEITEILMEEFTPKELAFIAASNLVDK
jgi:hypothetical protein